MKVSVCHPDVVSPVKVPVARFCPEVVYRFPMWVPVFPAPL